MNKLFTILIVFFSSYAISQQTEEIQELKADKSLYIELQPVNISARQNKNFIPSINSESNISLTGAFSQVVPIEVFKGINELQPNLSLVYSSQSNGGLAGEGWNISGLSSITRGGKSLKIDNSNEGITFNDSDPYYLDGQRLIFSNGEYKTETLSEIKIKKINSDTFTVHFTDGRISTYKKVGLFDFSITEMRDAFGNKITYEYQNDGNITYIKKISYGEASLFSINFEYKDNPNRITSYINGVQFISKKALFEIKVNSKEGLYRKYVLTHDYTSLKYPRLREINIYNQHNEALRPLKYTYNSEKSSRKLINQYLSANYLSKNTLTLGSVVEGDFMGNGSLSTIYVINENNKHNLKHDKTKEYYTSIIHEKIGPIVSEHKFDSNLNLHAGKIIDEEDKLSKSDYLVFMSRNIFNKNIQKYNQNNIVNTTYQIKAINPVTTKEFTKDITIPSGIDINKETQILELSDDFYEISGDFNNDGLIDLLIFRKESYAFSDKYIGDEETFLRSLNYRKTQSFNHKHYKTEKYPSAVYFYELGKDIKNPGSVQLTELAIGIDFEDGKVFPINYDQDGMTDFLFVDEKKKEFNIKSIKRNPNGSYSLVQKLNHQRLEHYQEGSPIVFGDFNGDGLTDFMTPTKLYDITKSTADKVINEISTDRKLWVEYINTGKDQFKVKERDFTAQNLTACKPTQRAVIKKSSKWQKLWSGKPDRYQFSEYVSCGVIAIDFNNDGRSDLVAFNSFGKITPEKIDPFFIRNNKIESLDSQKNSTNDKINRIAFIENKTSQTEEYDLETFNDNSKSINNVISPFTFINASNSEKNLESFNIGLQFLDPFSGKKNLYDIQTHDFLETQISRVDNGSGVVQNIEYVAMSEIIIFPNSKWEGNKLEENRNLYYQIDTSISNHLKYPYYVNRKQPGLYLVSRVNTLFDDDQSISKEYRYTNAIQDLSGKGFIGFQKIATSNPYESTKSNNQYLPKKVGQDILWSVDLYDPLLENQLVTKSIGNLKGDQYTTKSSVKYKKITDGHRYTYVKEEELSEDKLRDFSIVKSYTYNSKGFITSTVTDYKTADSLKSEEKFEYEPDFTSRQSFFVGKIKKHENISKNSKETFSTKNIFSYDKRNGNVIKDEKYGHNTSAIVTEYKYDAVGNKIEETLSGQGINTLTTKLEYDSTKRYVTKTTSPEGKEESVTIDLFGNPLITTSYLSLKTTYKYDNWGNNIEVVDPYNIKTTLIKQDLGDGKYSLSTSTPGVPSTIVIYDKFDRAVQQKTQSINNKWIFADIEYDLFGKKIRESEPYFEGETKKWNVTEYDALDRITKYTQSDGKIITTCYEGLGITIDEGHKKTSKLYDSAGRVIKHTDKGGSITYDYYPNGTLKSSNYDGIIISVVQDGWGNKIEMNDPSAGKYSYEYDALGNILKEISPKGSTEYNYDNFYKLVKEKVISDDNSSIDINYEYDTKTLLPSKTHGTSNGKVYEYETFYDELYRLKGKKETTNDFVYESYLTYDSENKVKDTSLKTTIKTINKSVNSKVTNVYDDNGFLVEERDAINNRLIKKVNEVNAQGQVKQLDFGNNLGITTSYDKDFLPSQINLANKSGGSELKIDYTFNAKRNLLVKRNIQYRGLAGSDESFTFDDLDRLTEEKQNNVVINRYVYDPRGRMVYNSDVGKYNYSDKNYKIHSIEFNSNGSKLLEERGLHQIKFNSYKQATEIYLEGKDRISYDFNLFKERSVAYYGNEEEDKNKRPYRKYYTSDKAVEIQFNGNDYKIITYIDGDPYSSSYIQINEILKNKTEKETYYYLHRDIQGTILALSSTTGVLVEKRLFDAWGNIKQVVHEDGTINKTLGIIDRGYTGHEHLQSVGLIHMNGRLYDSALRRFISPDNFVQDPYNTQNFDRYTYVYNNPLLYTDPSGEFIVSALIGVGIGIVTNAIMNAIQGVPIWYGMGKTIAISAASGVISFQIGEVAKNMFTNNVSRVFFQAGAHATSGGIMSAIDGGKFLSGFASGAISSLAGSGVQGLNIESEVLRDVLTITSGGLTGGISATIAGGDFWKGMRHGLITTGLNHTQHKFVNSFSQNDDNGYERDGKGGYKQVNTDGGDKTDYLYENGEIIEQKTPIAWGGEVSRNRSYGQLEVNGTGGATIDPSGKMVLAASGGGALYGTLRTVATYGFFGINEGNGFFGRDGLNIGNTKIEAMYKTPSTPGTGTIISIKQMKPGGNLFRLDYGKFHKTEKIGLHSTIRFRYGGVQYGSTAQRRWYPPFKKIKPPKK